MLSGAYKLLAQILAKRIIGVLHGIVSTSQNAFVAGRQILNVILVANENIDSWLHRGLDWIIWKLELRKLMIMSIRTFIVPSREDGVWVSIEALVSFFIFTIQLSILVNGSPAGFF